MAGEPNDGYSQGYTYIFDTNIPVFFTFLEQKHGLKSTYMDIETDEFDISPQYNLEEANFTARWKICIFGEFLKRASRQAPR